MSSCDVFAVGWHGSILHYDGTQWTAMTSAMDTYLYPHPPPLEFGARHPSSTV